MPQPVLGNQVLQDTFEKLGDQVQDVVSGFKDLATGGNDSIGGDNGIEQLSGQNDPKSGIAGSNSVGQTADPQRLAQRQAEEQEAVKFHREQVQKWDDNYKRMKEEDEVESRKKEEEEKKKEEQRIFQLREQDARSAVLNPVKPGTAKGPGSAFATQSTKSQTEFSKSATQ
ncbi:hypothetical protein HYU89_00770 [Candidatus Collierbacteria bacterium]|nr:hypothetical protein [Candidatus Collierbacteria bacterium]